MTDDLFFNKLKSLKAYREARLQLADEVLQNEALLEELISTCFLFDDPVSSRACWVLEFVCYKELERIIPFLDAFTMQLQNFTMDSSIRPVAKICMLLVKAYFSKKDSVVKNELDDLHLEQITAATFDWLINDEKTAPKAFAIYTLFELGKKYKWIYPELKSILEKDIHGQSAGYRSAASKILKRISKESG